MYLYNWYQWLIFFYLYCFFGWIFESSYVSIKEKKLVNRGFLRSPMLPLYGTGAVVMLWVTIPVKDNLIGVYFSGVIAATILEYITGYVMERLFKIKYWDYSNLKLQFQGYICLSSSIAWGFLTILLTEYIHTPIERLVLNLNATIGVIIVVVLSGLFLIDAIKSIKAALDLGKVLESMTRMKNELEEIQNRLESIKKEAEEKIESIKEEAGIVVTELKEATKTQWEGLETAGKEYKDAMLVHLEQERISLLKRFKILSYERAMFFSKLDYFKWSLLKGNPGATSRRFSESLKELVERIESKRKGKTK